MTDAERTYTNLMIFKIMTSTKGRISVKQIHAAIEPNMGVSLRSLQRYLNGYVGMIIHTNYLSKFLNEVKMMWKVIMSKYIIMTLKLTGI